MSFIRCTTLVELNSKKKFIREDAEEDLAEILEQYPSFLKEVFKGKEIQKKYPTVKDFKKGLKTVIAKTTSTSDLYETAVELPEGYTCFSLFGVDSNRGGDDEVSICFSKDPLLLYCLTGDY